jgi:hypothetical protein
MPSTPTLVEEDMKQKNLTRTLVAALLTLAASAAYGQVRETTAKIPFAFRAVGSDLPAGQYKVVRATGNSTNMRLQNLETGKSVFIHAQTSVTDPNDVRARLIFKCAGEDGCALARIWGGTGRGLEFATPRLTANQRERRETIYLDRFQGK